jgi:hypothetical protein
MNYDQQISKLESELTNAEGVRASLQAELDSLRAETSIEGAATRNNRIADLVPLVQALDNGELKKVGIPIDRTAMLAPLVGRPSPKRLREQIAQLRAARDAAVAKAKVDPDGVAGPFRFTGPGKHYVDGRRLQQGDVIDLTHSQAVAFADKFTRVEGASSAA